VLTVFVLIPVVLIGAAAIAAAISVAGSSLRITDEGVAVRNYRQPERLFPLADVDHFEPTPSVGNLSFLRPSTAALVLTDGSRIAVRRTSEPEAGRGVDALNARLAALKQ
jgi:hypothetical protein